MGLAIMKASSRSLNHLIKIFLIENAVPKAILFSLCLKSYLPRNALIFEFSSVNCYLVLTLCAAAYIMCGILLNTSQLIVWQLRICCW